MDRILINKFTSGKELITTEKIDELMEYTMFQVYIFLKCFFNSFKVCGKQ